MSELFSLARVDWSIYVSFIGVAAILVLPRERQELIRGTALLFAAAGLFFAAWALFHYELRDVSGAADPLRESFRQFEVDVTWIPALGISYHLGADGISLPLLVLNGIVAVTGVLFSWNIQRRTKEFFALFLTLVSGVYGVFLSLDLFLLFAFYELAIIPKYFLIAIWGSKNKDFAAMKLVLYSFAGSGLVLIGMLAMFFAAGGQSFDLLVLRTAHFPAELQFWAFPCVFIGFGVLAGMWPFHTWAPTGHAAAPTAASMLLAGVVMKLGAYGCLRVAILLLPRGMSAHGHFWQWVIAVLAVIAIVFAGTVALVQRDLKYVIGYSSVSHMGFVLLGLMALNTVGLDGAVLQMFSHGIVASLLFAVVGRIVYDRTHTRDLDELSRMQLARKMPFAAGAFIIAGLASMGLPGLSGFIAELHVLVGAFESFPWLVVAAGAGIVVAVWYTFRAVHLTFFGEDRFALGAVPSGEGFEAISWHEKVAASILIAVLVVVGLYPPVLLGMIDYSATLMIACFREG
jgi:NADH-quinone oxidoreductase subunit M